MIKPGYRTLTAAIALTVIAAAPRIANAQTAAARQACRADYSKFCAGTTPGGGRILACLQSNTDKLSPGCKDALKASAPK